MTAPATWFARLGLALTPDDQGAIVALIQGHAALARAEIGSAAHWHEAAEIIRAADWDGAWWDHEEEERQRLWQCAAEHADENALLAHVTAVTEAHAGAARAAATMAAARDGVSDPALIRTASGAALMSVQQWTLAELAGEGDVHFFRHKHALFVGGRWPLGFHRGRYVVF